MTSFIGKYEDLRNESIKYITDFLKNNGGRFEFFSQEQIESDDFYEYAWELPQAFFVSKYEIYCPYAITSITLEKDNIWFNGVDLRDSEDDYSFGVHEVDITCLCDCADNLIIKEK